MSATHQKNDAFVKTILEEGEKIEWSGVSDPYPIRTEKTKKKLYIRWGICLACIILWAIYCIVFHSATEASGRALAIGMILVILFFAYLAAQPMMERKKIVEKNSYYLTNRRAILVENGDKAYVMSLYGVLANAFPAEEDHMTLLLQKGNRDIPKDLRFVAWKPLLDSTMDQDATDIVFYNVKKDPALTRPFH